MKVGIATNGGNSDICKILGEEKKKSELKQHSIYVLPDDSDTDFDFYVLVDSKEARKRDGFLKKLHDYITTNDENKRNGLLNSLDEKAPGLKILIEKYPYRLFVAIDKDDWKVNDKTPLDNDFPWDNYKSQFIKKRICWIDKKELENAFDENNQSILEIKELDDPKGDNILADDNKFKWQERAKLWLYYKWVEHLKQELQVWVGKLSYGEEGMVSYFAPITCPLCTIANQSSTQQTGGTGVKEIKLTDIFDDESSAKTIPFLRHSWPSQLGMGLSGEQFIFHLITRLFEKPLSNYGFNDLMFILLLIESIIQPWVIVDERFAVYFSSFESTRFEALRMYVASLIEYNGKKEKLSQMESSYSFSFTSFEIIFCRTQTRKKQHLIIIHQGILDKLGISNDTLIRLKDNFPFFVVTSGRGMPPNISPLCKFIPFSVFEGYLLKNYPEKPLVNKIIMKGGKHGQ